MFKLLNKKKNNKGFTLVELVIVIAILAILVGLLAPQYTKYVEKTRKTADVDNMDEMVKAVQTYAVDNAINTANGSTEKTGTISLGDTVGTSVSVGGDLAGDITAALDEYVPGYAKLTRKSAKWSAAPTATITIDADGKVTAEYAPNDFKTYSESK